MKKVMLSRRECRRRFDGCETIVQAMYEYTWYTLSGRSTRKQRRQHRFHKQALLRAYPDLTEVEKKQMGFGLRDYFLGLWCGPVVAMASRRAATIVATSAADQDAPWSPSDREQALGRIERGGAPLPLSGSGG